MSDIAHGKQADVSAQTETVVTDSDAAASIRVSPNGYFSAIFPATFFAAFLLYLEYDVSAALVFAGAWLVTPFLFWNDRIVFDGRRIWRTGLLPNFWATLNNARSRLKISDIEQVETQALRALKRGGNVFYRYRTSLKGKDAKFVFASGGEDYRRMVNTLFSRLSDNILDNRSIELRDFLREPKETLMKAEFAHIPSVEVLEGSLNEFQNPDKKTRLVHAARELNSDEAEKADYLHRLANELRLSGYLLQSLEAFRRALVFKPKDARLLFDYARCLNSFAGSERSERLHRKSLAALRLAEKRAGGDGEMLARLGENYFQFGDFNRAKSVFEKSVETAQESFRSARGLAEIALREGKIAHVIHQFSIANRLAESSALRRWTQSEADYFTHLNNDDDYAEMEISRINLLETLVGAKRTALKIAVLGFPAVLVGIVFEDSLISNFGWAISGIALAVWTALLLSLNLFSERIPYELIENDE